MILYTRCADVLRKFKYAGYSLLLKVIATSDEEGVELPALFSEEKAPLLLPAARLLEATIATAPLNAMELYRVGGVDSVISLFRRCVPMLTPASEMESLPVACALPLLRTIAGIASSPSCLAHLTCEERLGSLADVVRCLHFPHLPSLTETALLTAFTLSSDAAAQMALVDAGIVWHLLKLTTKYDFTLDEGGVATTAGSNVQLLANQRAKLAITTLHRIAGYPGAATPDNPAVQRALDKLLTRYLAQLLSSGASAEEGDGEGEREGEGDGKGRPPGVRESEQLLRLINSTSETPYLVWNSSLRGELIDFLDEQLRLNYSSPSLSPLAAADSFVFQGLKDELKVGSVYVHVYNARPSFPLYDAPQFCAAVLRYLSRHSTLHAEANPPIPQPNGWEDVAAALQAMENLLRANHELEEQLLLPGQLETLLSFAWEGHPPPVLSAAVRVSRERLSRVASHDAPLV